MLTNYEHCLRQVDYKKCKIIADKYNLSSTYQQPGPAGAQAVPRTYPTPGHRCLAEIQDLLGEMAANVRIVNTIGKDKENFCLGVRSLIYDHESTFMCPIDK